MSKHTLAPWVAEATPRSVLITALHKPWKVPKAIAMVFFWRAGRYRPSSEVAIANARLMAAAPDLLMALECLSDVIMKYNESLHKTTQWGLPMLIIEEVKNARTAIEKATGGSV